MATPNGLKKLETPKVVQNMDFYEDADGNVWIKVNPKKRLGPSKSGKTILVGTTTGIQTIAGVSWGLNAFVK
jgi:hypothetical protein